MLSIIYNCFVPLYWFPMNLLTFLVNLFIRRDESIVLFGSWSGNRFAGNTRFLFQYLSENKEKYGFTKVVWVTRKQEILHDLEKMGYEVYLMHSRLGFYYHFKAGKHFSNAMICTNYASSKKQTGDIMGVFSLGAEHYYLHHGMTSIKKNLLEDNDAKQSVIVKMLLHVYKGLSQNGFIRHWFLNPGGWDEMTMLSLSYDNVKMQEGFWDARGVKCNYVVAGFPELCNCLRYTENEEKVISVIRGKRNKLKVLYAPTYRTSDHTGYYNPLNDEAFCKFLEENEIFWMEKIHPGAKDRMKASHYPEDYSMDLGGFDLNLLIGEIDVVITDYSTLYLKGLLTGKAIIFYMPDREGYCSRDKSLRDSFLRFSEVSAALSIEELTERIREVIEGRFWDEKRRIMCEKEKSLYVPEAENTYEIICERLLGETKSENKQQ